MSDKTATDDRFKLEAGWDEDIDNQKPLQHQTKFTSDEDVCKASQAFDQWFACLTVGKQLSNYYRYGEKRGCGQHWSKLKLCMGVKLRSAKVRRELIRQHKEAEESKRDRGPSVLDVWTRRNASDTGAEDRTF